MLTSFAGAQTTEPSAPPASEAAPPATAPATTDTATAEPVPEVHGPKVMLKTNMGNIVLQLNADKAPKTSANFVKYVKEGFYNGTIFHRVVSDFMIQGGGYDKQLHGKPTHPPIRSEASNGLQNETYSVAMAREDNQPNSATSQFFINVADNYPLDYPNGDGWGYCVFGKVVEGMDVVERIKKVKTEISGQFEAAPIKPVFIVSAAIIK
ncbi:MAG: peptidylprolyl isomerase [Burkholderiaceae bacterium]|nr:peptidylprolyl isomerase [Burkholderiaceae bacterium]